MPPLHRSLCDCNRTIYIYIHTYILIIRACFCNNPTWAEICCKYQPQSSWINPSSAQLVLVSSAQLQSEKHSPLSNTLRKAYKIWSESNVQTRFHTLRWNVLYCLGCPHSKPLKGGTENTICKDIIMQHSKQFKTFNSIYFFPFSWLERAA